MYIYIHRYIYILSYISYFLYLILIYHISWWGCGAGWGSLSFSLFLSVFLSFPPTFSHFSLFLSSPGPPDPPSSCLQLNLSASVVGVRCGLGFDGGVKQRLVMLLYDQRRRLRANVSSHVSR